MNTLNKIAKTLRWLCYPITRNSLFFFFTYLLGWFCALLTLPNTRGASLYDHLFAELFVDLYVLCALLLILPQQLRSILRGIFSVFLYIVALVDVYCFDQFHSTLTPTMLQLLNETDSREVGDFLQSYLSLDILFSPVGWVLLLISAHLFCAFGITPLYQKLQKKYSLPIIKLTLPSTYQAGITLLGIILVALALLWGGFEVKDNKAAMKRLFSYSNIGDVEHELTKPDKAVLYMPVYRLFFSIYANNLADRQVETLLQSSLTAQVDSCQYSSPHIVLIIGESFSRHHSQQYGYFMPTTPRQKKRQQQGRLVRFTDVVAPWNLTSFVFKNTFSTHLVGQKGEWCDTPLFPQIFRAAGYHVTFLTNQFLPKAGEAVFDFSGGFFLNNPELSRKLFDTRNKQLHTYDEGLLADYDALQKHQTQHNLTIFHLLGQHVTYRQRYPRDRQYFNADDYIDSRPNLHPKHRRILSDYDNAIRYNDSIVDQIIQRFEKEDAIVIYMPDHGEECYEEDRGFFCRQHSTKVDYDLARYEFEIPFWIYCTRRYVKNHPDLFQAVWQARHKRFMTDALPHLLFGLAGIHTPYYQDVNNLISPNYNEYRPRLLKGYADYDKLREESQKKEARHENR